MAKASAVEDCWDCLHIIGYSEESFLGPLILLRLNVASRNSTLVLKPRWNVKNSNANQARSMELVFYCQYPFVRQTMSCSTSLLSIEAACASCSSSPQKRKYFRPKGTESTGLDTSMSARHTRTGPCWHAHRPFRAPLLTRKLWNDLHF